MDAPVAIPREVAPSVVFLRSEVPAAHPSAALLGEERLGAGVAVAEDRVLTAHYLVMGARRLEVESLDGRPREVRRTVVDHESGLAVLFIDGPPLPAPPTGATPEPGTPVFLMTCTPERGRTGTTGHVMRVGPFEAFWEYMLDGAIMTTAINPGLAGAPLFDRQGGLLGIVSLGLASVGRYSLAIPVELYHERREALEAPDAPGDRRAWVGFFPQAIEDGVVVSGVVAGGPAEAAGLVRGDVVLSVDGEPVTTLRELYRALWRRAPGDSVSLQVLREKGIRVVEVTGGDRDAFYR